MSIFQESLNHAILISVFVFIMMVLVDYLNVLTQGNMSKAIRGSKFRQYLVSSFLGAIPGCLGSFMTVSFYVHGLISFGALVSCMIATSGDEAFVMLGLFPAKALLIFLFLFVIAVPAGYVVDKLSRFFKFSQPQECKLDQVHKEYACRCLDARTVRDNFLNLSFTRFLLIGVLLFFIFTVGTGIIGPKEMGWEKITLLFVLGLGLFIVSTVPEHYLEEHIWNHIFKHHIWRIFLWTLGALLVVNAGLKFFDVGEFINAHKELVLIVAALVGIIPESGPHLLFVVMFYKGLIPLSVLLVNSIVQDGHGLLPLLSYSLRDTFICKVINILFALIIGFGLYFLGV